MGWESRSSKPIECKIAGLLAKKISKPLFSMVAKQIPMLMLMSRSAILGTLYRVLS